ALSDADAALIAAEECVRLDRTARRIWGTNAAAVAAQIHAGAGDIGTALGEWRRVIAHFDATGDRIQAAQQIGMMANAIVAFDPAIAIELGAIVESGCIASTQVFESAYTPDLNRAAQDADPATVTARIDSVAKWSYRDAMDRVLDAIDELTARSARV